jgi:hypothetical protein
LRLRTSSSFDASTTWTYRLYHADSKIQRDNSSNEYGYSLRCIEGEGAPVPPQITDGQGTHKLVFLTANTYNGDLGGVAGADAKCQAEATGNGLSGTYKAWIADGDTNNSPNNRFNQASVPYRMLTNGDIVSPAFSTLASNWAGVTDGSIDVLFNYHLDGTTSNTHAWTNVSEYGNRYKPDPHCSSWTTSSSGIVGRRGGNYTANYNWTDNTDYACNNLISLYCFEQ